MESTPGLVLWHNIGLMKINSNNYSIILYEAIYRCRQRVCLLRTRSVMIARLVTLYAAIRVSIRSAFVN